MSGRPRTEIDVAVLIAEYRRGASLRELAERHGIGYTTVRTRLHEAGIELRSSSVRLSAILPMMARRRSI